MSDHLHRHFLCPVRPSSQEGRDLDDLEDDEWVKAFDDEVIEGPDDDLLAPNEDKVEADDGNAFREPRGSPAPRQPTPAEVARHNLTHLPYRNWCPHCVACRRANAPHRSSPSKGDRSLPLFVADYAFIRKPNEDVVTMLVGRLYPSRAVFASVCDVKGPTDHTTNRLTEFLNESGISQLVYKSDQEPAIKSTIEESLRRLRGTGVGKPDDEFLQLVPEYSSVGENPSNGRAERTIQQVQDLVRTYLHALEARIKRSIPCQHPIITWMVAHAANMLNRYSLNPDGVTPYASLHGKNSTERHAEFGEKIFWHVPKRVRTKLCARWRLGIFLGVSNSSNDIMVADGDGKVIKTRAFARVTAKDR